MQTAFQKPRSGVKRGGSVWTLSCKVHNYILEKRLSTLILDTLEFSQNSFRSQGLSNGRRPYGYATSDINLAICEDGKTDAIVAYTSVGFCVAVRLLKGNARSLKV